MHAADDYLSPMGGKQAHAVAWCRIWNMVFALAFVR